MLNEFKDFALKGNVVDLAVGVVMGAAFGKIVSGLVDHLIMPIVGLLIPGGHWRSYELVYGRMRLGLGPLAAVLIDFVVVAFVLFLVTSKLIGALNKKQIEEPTTRECPACLEQIPKAARRCKFCTEDFRTPTPTPTPTPTAAA